MKVMWHTAKYGDPYSEFMLCIYPSKCTHTAVNTHTHREHTWDSGQPFYAAASRELGGVGGSVPCSRVPRRGIEGVERAVHSLPHWNPCRTETRTRNLLLWVRLSNIRPQPLF